MYKVGPQVGNDNRIVDYIEGKILLDRPGVGSQVKMVYFIQIVQRNNTEQRASLGIKGKNIL